MADNIVLKTYTGGTVSPLDDAIIQQTVISTNGIFKGCNITNPRGNVLQISSGFGMIKGRFFEVYDCEIGVVLNSEAGTLQGRLYIHMDLSNTDEPIQILTETAKTLTDLDGDEDVNYNNTFYNMELARFGVTQTGIIDLAPTFQKIIGASGSGGGSTLKRAESYEKGDFAYCDSTLGWVTLYCTTAGKTAETEPVEYSGITKIGDTVQDGTCIFTARDVIGELDLLKDIQENNPNVPVGTIRFMSSSHADDTWLRCDGSYINEKNYPELVAALGKSLPEGEKFTLLSDGEIPPQISNGVVYNNRMWVYSYSARKLYGVDLEKSTPIKTISFTSTSQQFQDFVTPSITKPLALSIVPQKTGDGAKLFLTQIIASGEDQNVPTPYSWVHNFLIYGTEFLESEDTLTMEPPFSTITEVVGYPSDTLSSKNYPTFDSSLHIPYVVSRIENGTETYYCSVGKCFTYQTALLWTNESSEGKIVKTADYDNYYGCQRIACSEKNKGDLVYIDMTSDYTEIVSFPNDIFMADSGFLGREIESVLRTSVCPLNISGEPKILTSFTTECYVWFGVEKADIGVAKPNIALPKAAKVFVDGGAYLFGKGIYLIFVGTGIVFSTNLDADSFGYLDTTSVLGIISQYGYLDYAKDEQYLYIMGQDSTSKVKIAKLLLNTQFDYATDGAWLPLICGDGLPAYIKAKVNRNKKYTRWKFDSK